MSVVLQNLKQNLVYVMQCNDQNLPNLGKPEVQGGGAGGRGQREPVILPYSDVLAQYCRKKWPLVSFVSLQIFNSK